MQWVIYVWFLLWKKVRPINHNFSAAYKVNIYVHWVGKNIRKYKRKSNTREEKEIKKKYIKKLTNH